MATYHIELNNKARTDGRHLLLVRITHNRKHRRLSTDRYVRKGDFNSKAKYGAWIRSSSAEHSILNEILKQKIRYLESQENEAIQESNNTPIGAFSFEPRSTDASFISFAKTEIERHKTKCQLRTVKKKTHLLNKIAEFNDDKEVMFSDLTVQFLKNYEDYWIAKGNKTNTLHTDLKGMRAIINSAIVSGEITADQNPFQRFKLKTEKTTREKLTEIELTQLESLVLKPQSLEWHSRNMFLLSFYCAGIRFSDVLQLRWKNIKDNHLSYVMNKNNELHHILLTEQAIKIIELYSNADIIKVDNFIFPLLKNSVDYTDPQFLNNQISSKNTLVNKYLKKIVKQAGIQKKVSFHVSRHTFAYLAIRKTGDLYAVSKSLNHKRIDTTQIYLKENDVDASDSIMKRVFNVSK